MIKVYKHILLVYFDQDTMASFSLPFATPCYLFIQQLLSTSYISGTILGDWNIRQMLLYITVNGIPTV